MRLWLALGAFLAFSGLGVWGYTEHQGKLLERGKTALAERDRDTWKGNAETAAGAARASEQAVADLKKQLADSGARADALEADNETKAAANREMLRKLKEQHAPSDSSPYMRALLDELCRESTSAACVY